MFLIPGKSSFCFFFDFSARIFGFTEISEITMSDPKASFNAFTTVLFIEVIKGSFDFSGARVIEIRISYSLRVFGLLQYCPDWLGSPTLPLAISPAVWFSR
jgi:hypothetical protein